MQIRTIEFNAHKAFLAFLEELKTDPPGTWRLAIIHGAHFHSYDNAQFSQALQPLLSNTVMARAFYMQNHDIYLAWQGQVDQEKLTGMVMNNFARHRVKLKPSEMIVFRDPYVDIQDLFANVVQESEMTQIPEGLVKKVEKKEELPRVMTPEQMQVFKTAQRSQPARKKPLALIVEDQVFSWKLLYGVLDNMFTIRIAATCMQGWEIFVDNAPEVVFLDIELTDISGHELARSIKGFAPQTIVIMVTGNNSIEDVTTARANKVDGFIVKPYSKQKIHACLEKFTSLKKGQ